MCGFLCSTIPFENSSSIHSVNRGPDSINNISIGKLNISHYLLNIRDNYSNQPILDNTNCIFFNGELYNTENEPDYLMNSLDYNDMDGEYVICKYNYVDNIFDIYTDPFMTKPCSFYIDSDKFVVGSYDIDVKYLAGSYIECKANTRYTFDLSKMKQISEQKIYKWDFSGNGTLDEWENKFSLAITKRMSTDKKIVIPMSSGYDSGLIVAESISQGFTNFEVESFYGKENIKILKERIKYVTEKNIKVTIKNPITDILSLETLIKKNIPPFDFYDVNNKLLNNHNIHNDHGGFGLYDILNGKSYKICISGQGADEVYADYKLNKSDNHKTINSFKDIKDTWPNFDKAYQRNYIGMIERIGGYHGVEVRYPFLDKNTVQSFLNLHHSIQDRDYKYCILNMLIKKNFPVEQMFKIGFHIK